MKISPFQVVVLSIFGLSIIAGVLVLALTKGSNDRESNVTIYVWGTMDSNAFNSSISDLTSQTGSDGLRIEYVEKRPENFDKELIEAIASGTGPDVILLSQDMIVRFGSKITPIPYTVLPVAKFKEAFISEAELYLSNDGILAMPFSIDPLVMYWNRDILTNAGIVAPPKTWDEFITLSPKLTVKDKNLNILKSGVSLGEYNNIVNAKEIISAMLIQAGSSIVQYVNGAPLVTLSQSIGAIGAINFYTDFANPVKPTHSWNRSLPSSLDMFASGDLAFYFGFASELSRIRDRNSNLNFDVTYFPQPKSASILSTFGKMYGLAVLRTSPNADVAMRDILMMTETNPLTNLSLNTGLPPVRRSMLVPDPSDPYQEVFYNSALRARAWLDPNPEYSGAIFKRMIESITGGENQVGSAISEAATSLKQIVEK